MELAARTPKPQFMLSTSVFNRVNEILKDLERSTRAELAIFSEYSGIPITQVGKHNVMDIGDFSSVAAGNYAATREMAKMLGEESAFRFLYLEGDNKNIYLCNIGYDFLLTIIFAKSVALGMVRIYANKAVRQLNDLLDQANEQEDQVEESIIDNEFNLLLGDALDSSFNRAE